MTASTRCTTEAEKIVEAALALGPQIQAAVGDREQARHLPAPLVQAMQEAGVFRTTMPHEWDGPEADPLTQVRVVEALSLADGSVGWRAMRRPEWNFQTVSKRDIGEGDDANELL